MLDQSNHSSSNGKRSFWLAPLAVLALTAAAGCDSGLGECPTNSTAQQTAGKTVMVGQCNSCHSGSNAKEGLDFSKDSVVKDEAASMYGEAEEGAMPPSGKLSDTDLEALRVYLACTQ